MSKKINIAIDGYSSCGKSTLAKQLAKKLSYVFIDTGAMYRAVTLFAIRKNLLSAKGLLVEDLTSRLEEIHISFVFNEKRGASDVLLNNENIENEIRQMFVSEHVSEIASIKEVRQKLVALQRLMGIDKGVVMDGRDIGTVVFPEAELKIFMTASPEVRAERRYRELLLKGQEPTLEGVRKNLEKRDYLDTHREEDPLRQADDAKVLDNSSLSQQQQLDLAMSWIRSL